MAKLLKRVEQYRLETEQEAADFIEEARAKTKAGDFGYSSTPKNKKSKGEIIDEWIVVQITEKFDA